MGRTSDRQGRLEPFLFFLVSALILVARVAYHPLPNWTNCKDPQPTKTITGKDIEIAKLGSTGSDILVGHREHDVRTHKRAQDV